MFRLLQVLPCLRSTGSALKADCENVSVKAASGSDFFVVLRCVGCGADELLTAVLALTVARFQADVDQGMLSVVRT